MQKVNCARTSSDALALTPPSSTHFFKMAMRQTAVRATFSLSSSIGLAGTRAAPVLLRPCVQTSFATYRAAVPVVRTFSSTNTILRQGQEWAKKGDIKYRELSKIAKQPSGEITIIDVREPDEVAAGMIPSAVSVPLTQFDEAFDANKGGSFERNFSFPRPSFDSPIVFYCRSGKRSAQAQGIAARNGWKNTRNYTGSWLDWVEHEKKQETDD
jgi:rhodanese-related sulfurtransferase